MWPIEYLMGCPLLLKCQQMCLVWMLTNFKFRHTFNIWYASLPLPRWRFLSPMETAIKNIDSPITWPYNIKIRWVTNTKQMFFGLKQQKVKVQIDKKKRKLCWFLNRTIVLDQLKILIKKRHIFKRIRIYNNIVGCFYGV